MVNIDTPRYVEQFAVPSPSPLPPMGRWRISKDATGRWVLQVPPIYLDSREDAQAVVDVVQFHVFADLLDAALRGEVGLS